MNEWRLPPFPAKRLPCAISRKSPTEVLNRCDQEWAHVAVPMMRWRWPNSDQLSSGLLGSPCTGWFSHSTLAISVDFRLFLASVKLYASEVLSAEPNSLRS